MNPRNISCYANALMQQFFMISPLRQAVLNVHASGPVTTEMQRMFAFLQESQRHHFDPSEFISVFAKRLAINQQNDANEFFSILTDMFEGELLAAEENEDEVKALVNDLFQVSMRREIVCATNGDHCSVGEENALTITAELFQTETLTDAIATNFAVCSIV